MNNRSHFNFEFKTFIFVLAFIIVALIFSAIKHLATDDMDTFYSEIFYYETKILITSIILGISVVMYNKQLNKQFEKLLFIFIFIAIYYIILAFHMFSFIDSNFCTILFHLLILCCTALIILLGLYFEKKKVIKSIKIEMKKINDKNHVIYER